MTELELLRQRKELVVLSAELQRATIVRRVDRVQANPLRGLLGYAANAASRPALWKLGSAAMAFAVRTYRRRRLKRSGHSSN